MQKINVFYMIFMLLIPVLPMDQPSELMILSREVSKQSLDIEEWTVTVKENIPRNTADKKIAMFDDTYVVTSTENKDAIKYMIEKQQQAKDTSVSFKIIIPKEEKYDAEIALVYEGARQSVDMLKNHDKEIQKLVGKFFTEKSKVFTCLTSVSNDIITSDAFLQMLSKNLKLENISIQIDDIKNDMYKETIYGYTELWENKIVLEEKPLNIQMVIQKDENQRQKIIIGTPILIHEY